MCCDDGAVFELYCRRGVTSLLQTFLGSRGGATIVGSDFGLIEEHLNFADFSLVACATCQFVGSVVVASDDFVLDASQHTSSSLMQKPTMLTPISVGDL